MANILISENEPDIQDILVRIFRRDGHDLHVTDNGDDTLSHALGARLDLLVMNPALPGLDGLDVCRKLRSDPRTQSLPILLLSVHQYPAEKNAAYQAGADDYLGKPFDLYDLLARANTLLTRNRPPEQAQPAQTSA
ncbi:response regulator [Actinoplanes sp. NPDC023801]|uniref:response regulator n=1 Tax=Actinoplanes sp. NPDC023801 TaxID=3154595 RepID=UPI0033DBE5B1